MTIACPACSVKSITRTALLRSATGIGPNPRCPACNARWTVGGNWQGNYMGTILIAVMVAGALGVKEKNLAPYWILPAALLCASYMVCRFAKPKILNPVAPWLRALHYVVLLMFLAVLIRFLIG